MNKWIWWILNLNEWMNILPNWTWILCAHSWDWIHITRRPTVDVNILAYDQHIGLGGIGVPVENLPRHAWNLQTKYTYTYNYWLAALVKWKCSSTKPTCLATGVVWYPDTEQNRPYKIPLPYQELNLAPTTLQASTLPVCHTFPRGRTWSNVINNCNLLIIICY